MVLRGFGQRQIPATERSEGAEGKWILGASDVFYSGLKVIIPGTEVITLEN